MKRVGKVLGVLAILVLMKGLWVGCAGVLPKRDLELRADYLVEKIERGDAGLVPASDRFGGEWSLVTRSMTALALARLAKDDPAKRAKHAASVRTIADDVLSTEARAFDTQPWGDDALEQLSSNSGHAGYLGHLGLILAAERMLGSHAHDDVEDAVAYAIAIRIERGELVETYPGETYIPDNVVLAAALALHANATKTDAMDDLARFTAMLREHVDPETGLLAFTPHGIGRGSGAGWNSYFLPMVDPAFAREQQLALEHLAIRLPLGMAAIREGKHSGDVDSGPLVFGISPAATGFAIAGARCSGDPDLARALERTAEVVGSTIPSLSGRSYALAPLVGDAILLAMRAGPPIGC
jgi:hypothetical protein